MDSATGFVVESLVLVLLWLHLPEPVVLECYRSPLEVEFVHAALVDLVAVLVLLKHLMMYDWHFLLEVVGAAAEWVAILLRLLLVAVALVAILSMVRLWPVGPLEDLGLSLKELRSVVLVA